MHSTHRANLAKRTDATHTVDVRQEFQRELNRRFRRLRGLVRRTIGYENDAANLSGGTQVGQPVSGAGTGTPEPVEAFPTLTTGALLAAFSAWFANAARSILLEPLPETQVRQGNHWTAGFVKPAFKRGVNQATGLLYQAGVNVENLPDDEILSDGGFRRAVQTRYWSPFRELRGVTRDMEDEMERILQEAVNEGWNPQKAAREMTSELQSFERDRADTIARTEILFSHSNGAIENYRRAGVGTVGHVGRLVTPDEDLCGFCRRLADETFTLSEFVGVRVRWRGSAYFIGCPAHPNGRCAPVPKPGVDADDLAPLDERVPGTIIAKGIDMYGERGAQPAFS